MNQSSLPPRRPPNRQGQPSGTRPASYAAHPSAGQTQRRIQNPAPQGRPAPRAIPTQRPPSTAQTRPPQTPHRQPTREEIIRRKRYLERKRAEERRRRQLHGTAAALIALLLLAVIIAVIRSCTDKPETPASAETVITDTPTTTLSTPPETASQPESTAPPETEPPASSITPATVSRPAEDASTVTVSDEIDSGYAVLIAPESGRILAAKNADTRMYPASMTKVMTLLTAYEHIDNLEETFTVTSAIIDPLYRSNASLAGFSPGETVTLRDLLYGTILPSGAEAAVSLAIHIAGSEEEFVKLMNEKAKEIGLTDTHFTNCTGLHNKDHYSTAVEIAMIMDCAMQHEACREILSTYQYTTPPTDKHPEGVAMTSTMLSRMYGDEPDGVTITAGKTGYTPEAGQCLVSYGTDDVSGEQYILVTSKAEGKFEPVFDAIEMYSDYT